MKNQGLITGIVMVVVFTAGIFLGYHLANEDAAQSTVTSMTGSPETGNSNESATNQSGNETESSEGTTISADQLTDGQVKLLSALGVDANNITITGEMIACAEAKLGEARIAEIQNGATPSFIEGTQLVACYQ